jgi:SepF-like predicted cell division protein (DUF552 family)
MAPNVHIVHKQLTEDNFSQIQAELDNGHVIFLDCGAYIEKFQDDIVKIKDTIDALKKVCFHRGGAFGRIGTELLILTPNPQIKLF